MRRNLNRIGWRIELRTQKQMSNAKDIRREEALRQTLSFVNEIGLVARYGEVPKGSFLRGVLIQNGELIVSPLARPADLLHEAAHLALLPAQFRPRANDNLEGVIAWMFEETTDCDPCSELSIAVMQSGDCEATAWAWAAGKAIGLNPDEIIHGGSYDGTGASIRHMLASNAYVGINGLAAANFCVVKSASLAKARGLPIFPELARWVQPVIEKDVPSELMRMS